MQFYLAPMEEVTGYVFRGVYSRLCGGIDKYYMPFIAPGQKCSLKTREGKEIDPDHNRGIPAVPQVLTADPERFAEAVHMLEDLGYREVDLNMGCPSGTVVPKGRGCGMLADLSRLDGFFDRAFNLLREDTEGEDPVRISVKTRLGLEEETEFPALVEVLNRYPLCQMTVHARIRQDYYRGPVRWDALEAGLDKNRLPVCYNGDIFTAPDYERFRERFPRIEMVMLGRGLVANPWLLREIRGGGRVRKEELKDFHDRLLEAYEGELGAKDALFKMKEVWFYLGKQFEDSFRAVRRINKAGSPEKYRTAVEELFACCSLVDREARICFP